MIEKIDFSDYKNASHIALKINEIIDHINKLEEEKATKPSKPKPDILDLTSIHNSPF